MLSTAASTPPSTQPRIAPTPHLRRVLAIPQRSAHETDKALVKAFAHDLKVACEDLYDEPFSPDARDNLMRLLNASGIADAANARLHLTTAATNA